MNLWEEIQINFQNILQEFTGYIPRIIHALMILIAGWIIARIAPANTGPDFGDVSAATKLILIALFSPIVETMIMAGVQRAVAALVTGPGPDIITPCGGCRQKLREFSVP